MLLASQWDGYDFPGGGINLNETVTQALRREVKEETGFDVEPQKLIVIEDNFHRMHFDKNFVHSLLIYYTCEIIGGSLSKDYFDKKAKEDKYMDIAQWIDLKDIGKIKFYNSIDNRKLLLEAQKNV